MVMAKVTGMDMIKMMIAGALITAIMIEMISVAGTTITTATEICRQALRKRIACLPAWSGSCVYAGRFLLD
jgi:hypothetical protein